MRRSGPDLGCCTATEKRILIFIEMEKKKCQKENKAVITLKITKLDAFY
jgi:hypothetical protein